MWLYSWFSNFHTHIKDRHVAHFPLNCSLLNARIHEWRRLVNIGAGNGLVPSGKKPLQCLPFPMSPHCVTRPQWVKEVTLIHIYLLLNELIEQRMVTRKYYPDIICYNYKEYALIPDFFRKIFNKMIVLDTYKYMYHFVLNHGDVINWKYFPRYWPFVRGIHRSPVNSLQKG